MKKHATLLAGFALLLLLVGCNDDNTSSVQSSGGGSSYSLAMPRAKNMVADTASFVVDRSQLGDRRIDETHRLSVEVAEKNLITRFNADFNKCLALKCDLVESQLGKTSGQLAARLLPDQLPVFLKALEEGEGEIVSHRVMVDDISAAYVDTAARLKNKEALRERLTRLLNSDAARNVSELLQIERELARVQGEIESDQGQMRLLESRTAKARVEVSYAVPYYAQTIDYKYLTGSFHNAWRHLIQGLADVVEFTGRALPWIPVWLAGLWVLVRTLKAAFTATSWRPWRRKEKKSPQAEQG